MANKFERYYITKTYRDRPLGKFYLKDRYTNEFVKECYRGWCPLFKKKEVKQIVSRLKAQLPPGWEEKITYSLELV